MPSFSNSKLSTFDKIIVECLKRIVKNGRDRLDWKLPEGWVQTELFKELSDCGLKPFDNEVPYKTYYPVDKPKNDEWKREGALKWIDLCLYDEANNIWLWIELKVRHKDYGKNPQTAINNAITGLKQDVVALTGFSREKTAKIWQKPDEFTKQHWFNEKYQEKGERINTGKHSFMSILLLIGESDFNEKYDDQVEKWLEIRAKEKNLKPDKTVIRNKPERREPIRITDKDTAIIYFWGQH